MRPELVTYTQWYAGKLVVVENVPAEVCDTCSEKLFSPETVDKLQRLIWSHAQPVRTLQVPVFDLATA